MSEIESRFVKRGLWTNLDQGPVMGRVITIDTKTGTIITAMLAVLATLGAAHLWHLITFVYHQFRANGRPSDGLFRQQQALLRTLPTPSSLMVDSINLWWAWRKRTDKAFIHSLTTFSLALFCTIGSLAAGIFSSYVMSSSNIEVLVSSDFCGFINDTSAANSTLAGGYLAAVLSVVAPYARECYGNSNSSGAKCGVFHRPNVPLVLEKAECPFAPHMCRDIQNETSAAISLDSGLVDVNEAFGLNLPRKSRTKYRKKTTCGILPTGGYSTVINGSSLPSGALESMSARTLLPGEQFIIYNYGGINAPYQENLTFIVSFTTGNVTNQFTMLGLTSRLATENMYNPIPEMQRQDADIAVKSVRKNAIQYTTPVDDPLFSAHKSMVYTNLALGENETSYLADSMVDVVGCAMQYQFCASSSSGEKCSPLSGLPLAINAEDYPDASPVQLSILQLLLQLSFQFDIAKAPDLDISKKLGQGKFIETQVPNDQWITEIKGWESFTWAALQTTVADHAIGAQSRDPRAAQYVSRPTDQGDIELCGMQKMRKSGGFVNINFFGLAFVVAVCCSITIIDILLLKFLVFLSKFSEVLAPRIDRWTQDSVLHLQRRAYEAHGKCNWTGLSAAIPVTSAKDILLDLPIGSVPPETEKDVELLFEKTTAENAKAESPRISRIEISHVENIDSLRA